MPKPHMFEKYPTRLQEFRLTADGGYGENCITDDFVTDVYLEFDKRTRAEESADYLRTLSGISLSLDATFKTANKATLVNTQKVCVCLTKGGLLTIINERNEIIAWTQSNAEIEELLSGLARRFELLGLPLPEQVVADNCCHIRTMILKVLPSSHVCLDIWHCIARYTVVVLNGKKNPYLTSVARDISSALLKSRGSHGVLAEYRNRDEAETMLQAVYEKYSRIGGVWTAAAAKVHADQLSHVKKGCLERRRQDIAADGSRIEGSHKAWNALRRACASGLEMFGALSRDFVLRRNLRIITTTGCHRGPATGFAATTQGSHHIRLQNWINTLFNMLADRERTWGGPELPAKPILQKIDSRETFGLVVSDHNLTFGGLLQIKDELDEDRKLEDLLSEREEELDVTTVLHDLNIDPALLHQPEPSGCTISHRPFHPSASPLALGGTHSSITTSSSGPSNVDGLLGSLTESSSSWDNLADGHCSMEGTLERVEMKALTSAQVVGDLIIDLTKESEEPTSTKRKQATLETVAGLGPPVKKLRTQAPVTQNKLNATSKAGQLQLSPFFSDQRHAVMLGVPDDVAKNLGSGSAPDLPSKTPPVPCQDKPASPSLINMLSSPLPVVHGPDVAGSNLQHLSRSERLFALNTGMNPQSLQINSDIEFYAFMDLRLEHGWATYKMNSRRYVEAADLYNNRLVQVNEGEGIQLTIKKRPRAIAEKLAKIEAMCSQRIIAGNYASKRNGDEAFWRKHCHAVPLGTDPAKQNNGKARKLQTCARCQKIKYIGGLGASGNHRKICCSDGVKTQDKNDPPPKWPQPEGVFTNGTHFHLLAFLEQLRRLYEKAIVECDTASEDMESEAFFELLKARLGTMDVEKDGKTLQVPVFRLYSYLMMSPPLDQLVMTRDSKQYLRVDCLRED
ncbi:hypothetical protein PHLCEN_2v12525 [Hermanssonia centrifuga]|uniref:Uncharacterized protein n=1 Tax=Hermanssonia centrifuga TaxID=98765 RepID=A0A2R6NGS9_9APHY|nr:hypothetical protein PHLCEN_2v12525 [Hermanssonia centrifuga]